MSFGVGVGDLIAVSILAKQLHRDVYMVARSAPDELQTLTRELGCLAEALSLLVDEVQDANSLLRRSGEARALTVREVVEGTRDTLGKLESLSKKHGLVALAREEKKGRSLARRGWDRVKFARDFGEVERLRGKMVYHYSVMQLLLTSVGNSSLERLESENRAMASSVEEIRTLLRRGSASSGAASGGVVRNYNVDATVNVKIAAGGGNQKQATPPPELPMISALEGDVADHLSQLFMEKAESRGSWLSVGLDAWIQNGKWWLMKSQTALGRNLTASSTVDPQTYTDLLKASWILLDVVSEHPQRTFLLGGTQQFTIRTLAEGIKSELRMISDAGCGVPSTTAVVSTDLTIWSSQTATSLELRRQLAPSQSTTAYGWSIANATLIYQKFGNFVSLIGDKVECVILLLVDSNPLSSALRKGHDQKGPIVRLVGQNSAGVDLVNIAVQAICVLELESNDGEYCLYECESEESSSEDSDSESDSDSDDVSDDESKQNDESSVSSKVEVTDKEKSSQDDDGWATESSSDEKSSMKKAPKQGIRRRRTGQDHSSIAFPPPLRRASTLSEREHTNTTRRFGKNRGDANEEAEYTDDSDEDDTASLPSTIASSKEDESDDGLQERRNELDNPIRAVRIEFPKSNDVLELYALFLGLRLRAEWFDTEEKDVGIITSICVLNTLASPTALPHEFIIDEFHRIVNATATVDSDKETTHAATYTPKPTDIIKLTLQAIELHHASKGNKAIPSPAVPTPKDTARAIWSSSSRTLETVYRILALTARASPMTFAPILRCTGFHPLVVASGGALDVFGFLIRTRKTHALAVAKNKKKREATKTPDTNIFAMEMLMQELAYTIIDAEFENQKLPPKGEEPRREMIQLIPEKDNLTWDMMKFGDEFLRNLHGDKTTLKKFKQFMDLVLKKQETKDRLTSLSQWKYRAPAKEDGEVSTMESKLPWESSPTTVAFLTERSLVGAAKFWLAFLQVARKKWPRTFCKKCGRYRCEVHEDDDDSSDDSDDSDADTKKGKKGGKRNVPEKKRDLGALAWYEADA